MTYKRIKPPYRVFEVLPDGSRRPLKVREIVVELRPGVEIEVDFAPHPNFSGQLVLCTPPSAHMKRLYDEGTIDDFAVVFGATNVLHVAVERRQRATAPTATTAPRSKRRAR